MCLLIETLRIENKTLQNIDYHNRRFNLARKNLFGINIDLSLADYINLNSIKGNGIYKCRIVYNKEIKKIDITPYTPKPLKTLQLVICDTIEYGYKYENRTTLNQLRNTAKADDVLIVKNGQITDLSFANIVFFTSTNEAFTPLNPLLKGTMRAYLLDQKVIKERIIKVSDLHLFNRVKPINAMLDFEKTPFINMKNIYQAH
ncbi:MAG: aminotransferase class IV [Flavobacteriales bacterium]|jgi:4-amino-4-deoxychorismate lyase|nr:aminotransferase class IV [Flavobacteriales bacterium]